MVNKLITAGKILAPIILIGGIAGFLFAPPKQVGYAPEQPIPYNHQLHAGEYGIDCQYCHSGVTLGKKAGVPATNVCMNCHGGIVGAAKPDVKKLKSIYNSGKSPEWIRVHNLPDHVRFSHGPHIKALLKEGAPTKEACFACHGDIANMPVVTQVKSLNMGFCVNCHRNHRDEDVYKSKGVSVSCNVCHY